MKNRDLIKFVSVVVRDVGEPNWRTDRIANAAVLQGMVTVHTAARTKRIFRQCNCLVLALKGVRMKNLRKGVIDTDSPH